MDQHFETQAIRNQMERTGYGEHSAPVFLSSSFAFETAEDMAQAFSGETPALIYSRYNNPNTDELVEKVSMLEGAEDGIATASGMAAVFAAMAATMSSPQGRFLGPPTRSSPNSSLVGESPIPTWTRQRLTCGKRKSGRIPG
jgi:cystathionine beta-lyase/cystathionine gamma-synthase